MDGLMQATAAHMIELIPGEVLARSLGYDGVTSSFRTFCAQLGIRPVRPGWYDPRFVRYRLDLAQGIAPAGSVAANAPAGPVAGDLVAQRRMRRGQC